MKTQRISLRVLGLAMLLGGQLALASSEIMGEALDGSSVKAFEAGMARVKAEGTEQEYARLKSAIEYLLYYDLAVNRDRAKLYQKLNGKTPEEIVGSARRK